LAFKTRYPTRLHGRAVIFLVARGRDFMHVLQYLKLAVLLASFFFGHTNSAGSRPVDTLEIFLGKLRFPLARTRGNEVNTPEC